jgi:hypothetical protein
MLCACRNDVVAMHGALSDYLIKVVPSFIKFAVAGPGQSTNVYNEQTLYTTPENLMPLIRCVGCEDKHNPAAAGITVVVPVVGGMVPGTLVWGMCKYLSGAALAHAARHVLPFLPCHDLPHIMCSVTCLLAAGSCATTSTRSLSA